MFRLDNLLERWAELYTPDNEKKEHPAFFRISMIDANSYFVRNFNTVPPTCIAYATHVDAEINKQNPKQLSYRHVVYFLQKQPAGTLSKTQITDEEGATEARFSTDDMAQDLIALLSAMKGMVGGKSLPSSVLGSSAAEIKTFIEDTAADPQYREGLRGLHIDEAHWGTLPTMLNGWQICGLTLEQTAPRLLCVNQERYIQE
jgi:hypothetical protein